MAPAPNHPSLLRALILRLTVATLVMVLLVVVVLGERFIDMSESLRDSSLIAQAGEIEKLLEVDADGTAHLTLPPGLIKAYEEMGTGFTYAVLDADNRVLFSLHDRERPITIFDPEETEERISYFHIPSHRTEQPVFGATVAIERRGRRFWIQVAQSAKHDDVLADTLIEEFWDEFGWVMLSAVALLLAINILTIRSGLRPLQIASRQAASIGPAALDIRLREDTIPREILPLVKAVNSVLDRLEKAFHLQRDFMADAAHELRTPLAVLTARIGTLDDPAKAEELKADISVINRIVSQLLEAAWLDQFTVKRGETADLSDVTIQVAAFLGPLAIDQGKSIAVIGAERPTLVHGNAEALTHAIRNLAENALKHTAKGTTVEIEVGADGTVRITDRGPGIPDEDKEKVFHRFWRASRRDTGAGLGLSIVSTIATAHGGTVAVSDAEPDADGRGGAVFTLTLPSLPAASVAGGN